MNLHPSGCDAEPAAATPNFDRLAGIYRWMEWVSFGPWLGWCRCKFLSRLDHCRRALILGDGDGRFTARLLAQNPAVRVDAVDASSAMLSELVRRAGPNACRVETYRADARSWRPSRTDYDLIVTHFFLDCLSTNEIISLAVRLRGCVRPGAVWVVSEFAVPHGFHGKVVARPLIAFLYWAFGMLTGLKIRSLPDYRTALAGSGFRSTRQHPSFCGLLVSEMWELGASE